jgi:hypothetical protein
VKYIVAFCWLTFCIWTVWKLRRPRAQGLDRVYRFGVKALGLGTWGVITLLSVAIAYGVNPNHSLFYYGAFLAFVLLPVCLWCGYFWGRTMSALFPTGLDK